MNKKLITGLIACGVLVGTATGATLRYRSSGDWGVITDGTSEGWGVNPNNSGAAVTALPSSGDLARLNWGGNTVTVTTAATVGRLQITVDEPGNLVVANGGSLTTVSGAGHNGDLVNGNNDADGLLGTLLVQAGGTVNTGGILYTGLGTPGQTTIEGTATVGSHLWTGWNDGITGTIDINSGGILNVSGQLGLNWNDHSSAAGLLNIHSGGVVNLAQIHASGNSIRSNSLLTIANGGLLTKSSNFVSIIQTQYIDTGKIVGEGGADLIVTYDSDSDLTTVVVVPEPSVFGLLGMAVVGFFLRRRRTC